MGRAEKKFAKKKERELQVKKKVLERRNNIRTEAKERKEKELMEHKYRNKQSPITDAKRKKEAKAKLEHNLEILKALEEEYLAQLSEEERAKLPNPEDALKFKGVFQEADSKCHRRQYPFEALFE